MILIEENIGDILRDRLTTELNLQLRDKIGYSLMYSQTKTRIVSQVHFQLRSQIGTSFRYQLNEQLKKEMNE